MKSTASNAISRRTLLVGSAAATASLSLTDWLAAQPSAARPKRSDVLSEDGKKMLALYKRAVAEMNDTSKWPLHHPFNWIYQANIHDYPAADATKAFDPKQAKTVQQKADLAQHKLWALGGPGTKRIWRTCSHHGYPEHFVTWHRMYLYFLERIIEEVVKEPFAFPYWTYAKDAQGLRRLPPEFRKPKDGSVRNALYFKERNDDFLRDGIGTEGEVDHKEAFDERSLLLTKSRREGFSVLLERTPHGSVHAAIGTTLGMGDFPYAARDPIFWLHHANIDRLWESWRKPDSEGRSQRDATGNSPTHDNWSKHTKFAFIGPKIERVEMSVDEVMKAAKSLGIEYDRLEGTPTAMAFAGESDEPPPAPTTLSKPTHAKVPQITSKDRPVTVPLSPAVAPPVALGFSQRPETRYHLVIDAEAAAAPGGAYDVFIKALKAPGNSEREDRLVGTFNLFASVARENGRHSPSITWKGDITNLVRDKLVDPHNPGEITFRARYANPKVPVSIKSYRIEAR
jgi:tyrosinase